MFNELISITLGGKHIDHKKHLYLGVKRLVDIIISLVLLSLLWPLFIIVALCVKIDSKGPAFLKQERIGKNGKPIGIYKFRSMVINAEDVLEELLKDPEIYEEYTTKKKLKNDPRITKVGKFIRKTSIDELPQLINILKGEMTLVGPRPYLPREKKDMGGHYYYISKMTPGLTGLWQVSGRSDCSFKMRLKLDSKYYYIRGLRKDTDILLKTFKIVFGKNGAM